MRSITNAVRTQVNKGVSQIIHATMVLADGTTTTLEQSSFFGNIAFEWATSQTGAFDVGSAVISSFKFSLNNFDGDFDDTDFAGARILPMIGIPLDDGGTNVSYIQFGTFYFVSHRTLGNVINCEAYDALKFMDEENCTASFPMTAKQFATYLKNKYSLALAENSFTNDGTSLPQVAVSMTDRQALVYAMQLTGNFAVINSAGKLHIGWYNTASAYSAPDVFEHNLWTNNLTITGVKVTPYQGSDGNAVSRGTTDYVVEISNNPFIRWDNVEAVANTLYNRLNGMSFRPGSITVLSSPVYEVGDCLSYTDKAGNTSVTPITNIRYSKSLRTTISCDCGEESTNDLRKIATVIGISGTEITYAVSSNGTTPPSSGWQDAEHMPTADEGEYLWTKVSISFTDGTVKNSYSSAYQGVSGISPIVTVEETTTGATISVTDASGETTTAEVKNGKSPNITTSKSGDTTTIYADGVEIGTITDGEEGKSPTITSSKVNGVTTVRADGVVIATINDGSSPVLTATKSGTTTTIYSDGTAIGTIEDGDDGPTGAKGEKGYVHIAWANSANGVTDFSTTVSAGKTYFGSYTDHTEADSTDPTKYNWSLIKGDKGDTGAKGDTGDKGDKGDKGDSATAYSLIVSHAAIAKSVSGTFSPTSITLTAKSQTGTNAYANYSGRFKIEVYNGSSWSTKYTSSSNENTKSYTIPSGTTQVRCSLYLAGGTTTLLDQQTIPVVSDGAAGGDAYTIILDNESHTFAGGTSAAIAGTATVNVYAYKGATAIAPTVTKANISGLPTGMSVQSVTNDSTNKKSTIVFAVTTSMVTRSGLVTIPVVADGKTFNKEFSYSLALQGTKGDTGDKGDKGDKGDTGKSLTGITEYYARNNSTAAPADSAFNTSVLTPTASEKYVWNYEQLSWNDNGTTSTTKTTKHIIAVYGDKGETGDKGNTGKSLTNVTEYYAVNNSTTAPADSSFSTTVAAPTSSNKYLWNYELLTWDDNGTTSTTKTDKHIAAVYGDKGDKGDKGNKGDKGDTGKALTGITEYYALNNSTTAPADSSFSTTVKTPTASNKYVWNYEQLSWNDNGTTSTTKTTKHIVAVYGDKGDQGDKGNTGKALTGITEYYAINNSTTAPADSAFGTSVKAPTSSNKYLWNYELLAWNDNGTTSTTKTDKHIAAVYGDKGDTGAKGDTGEKGDKGDKGDTGVSISSVTNYYLATSASSGVTTSTSGWTTTVQTMNSTKQYLWNYEVIKGSDNSTLNTTIPVIIGRYGQNGGKGDKGDAGRGITSIAEHYQVSSSNTTAPSSWSDTMVNTTATNKYLWNYETITYTDGTTEDSTKRVIGTHGEKGNTGASIASVTNYYLASASSSGVTTSTSGWTTNPTASAATMTSTKQYLWNYEVIKDSNNTTITTTSPVIIGRYGQNGGTGSAGKGITGITEYYLATSASSGVTTSTSGWTTAVQSTTATNKYLWNYEVISYTSGNPYASDPRIIGTYGDKGDKGVGVTSITKTGTSGTVDTYTITYTDGTTSTFSVTNGTNGTSAEWFCGTVLTHTSGTATAAISGAKVGDMYLNTATSNVYKCVAANKWTYAGNIADGVIDNISIGGRNLLLNSSFTNDYDKWSNSGHEIVTEDGLLCGHIAGVLSAKKNISQSIFAQIKDDNLTQLYTVSADIKLVNYVAGSTNPFVALYLDGQYDNNGGNVWLGATYVGGTIKGTTSNLPPFNNQGWVHVTYIFRFAHKPISMDFYIYSRDWEGDLYYRNVKLERGNIATDWTPAPEDVQADIEAVQEAADEAQATADRKKQTFISTPTTPYYVGDTYFVNGKLLVCHTERLTGSYTADDWSEDLGYASSDTVATLEASTKTELDTIRSEASANYTSLSDSLDKIQASFNTQVEQTSEDFSIRINGLLESLTSLANDTSTKFAEYSKYFRFTADGLEIGEESNALTLVLDNDKISFRRNGVEFSYWDGSDNSFHVGDIIVDVNQVARFGSFGLVPLEGGDLAWKWLGGST